MSARRFWWSGWLSGGGVRASRPLRVDRVHRPQSTLRPWDKLSGVTDVREPIRVGVLGARGRMGLEVCRAVDAADDLELVAMIDQGDWLFNAADAGAQVLVDFTTPDVVMDNLHWAVDQGINVVVGTTGFTDQRLERVRNWLVHKPDIGVIIAPNFGVGAVLMMQFAARAARFFESVEIVE